MKLCFINKVREEHDQIINQFGEGATRLANHPKRAQCIYINIDAACLPLSSDSFPASLLHPNSSPLIYLSHIRDGGVLWVRAIFRARSPPPGQQAKICLLFAIRLNVRVNS